MIAFALSAVAEDEDIAVGFIIRASVNINKDVRAELVPPDIKALRIGFTRILR